MKTTDQIDDSQVRRARQSIAEEIALRSAGLRGVEALAIERAMSDVEQDGPRVPAGFVDNDWDGLS